GPSYDATGAGNSHTTGTTMTWLHSAASGAYVVVGVVSTTTVSRVTYGATSMTLLGSIGLNNGGNKLYVYGLNGVSSGSTTITVSATTGIMAGSSVSYTNVTSVGTAQTTFG